MKTCLNYKLPYFQNLFDIYGEKSTKEIMAALMLPKYKSFLKADDFPVIKNHTIINDDGKKLDVRTLIFFTKNDYEKHLEKPTSLYIVDDYFDKKKQYRIKYLNEFDEKDSQKSLNIVITKALNDIKNKKEHTFDEKLLLNGKLSINDFFGLKDIKYKPAPLFNSDDFLFEVFYKMELYNEQFKDIISLLKNNIHNNIKFSKITTKEQSDNLKSLYGSDFYAIYLYNVNKNEEEIIVNNYLIKSTDYSELKYTDDNFVKLLIHELLHSYINYKVYTDDFFHSELTNILENIKSHLSEQELLTYNNQLESVEELVVYSFIDESFKKLLNTIPVNYNTTLLKYIDENFKFKNTTLLNQILNLSTDAIFSRKEYNNSFELISNFTKELNVQYSMLKPDILQIITNNLMKDWSVYKDSNLSFEEFKKSINEKISKCLL